MTRSERSVFDQWLEPDVRDKITVGFSMHDFLTIRRQAEQARQAPRGHRRTELEMVARRWKLSRRTLDRYLEHPITTVRVNGWEAVYRTPADGPPRRVTVWTRADDKRATRKEQEE